MGKGKNLNIFVRESTNSIVYVCSSTTNEFVGQGNGKGPYMCTSICSKS